MSYFLHLTIFFLYIYTLSSSAGKLAVAVAVILSKLDHRPMLNDTYYKTTLVRELISILLANAIHFLCTMLVIIG